MTFTCLTAWMLLASPLSAAVLEGLAPINAKNGDLEIKPQWDRTFDNQTVSHLMLKARESYEQGNLTNSLRHLKDAKRRLPLNADIKIMLSHIYISLGKYDEALDEIYNLLDADPKNPTYLRITGFCHDQLGQYEKSIDVYERFARSARTSEKPHMYLGSALFKLDRIDEAIEAYEKAVAINPDNAETHEALGSAWHQAERYEEAIASFKKAIAADPNFAPAYNSLGTTYFADGKEEQGMENVRRAILVDPNFSDAFANLGSMYALQKQTKKAIELYTRALDKNISNTRAWDNLLIAIGDELPKPKGWEIATPNRTLDGRLSANGITTNQYE